MLTLYTDQGTMSNILHVPFFFFSASRSRYARSVFPFLTLYTSAVGNSNPFPSFVFLSIPTSPTFLLLLLFFFSVTIFSTFFSPFFIILPVLFPATSYSSSPSDFLTFPSFPIHYPLPLPAVSSFFLPSLCRPFLSLGKLGGRFRCWARLGYGIAYSF